MPSLTLRTRRMLLRPLVKGDRDEFIRVHELNVEHFGRWSPAVPPGQTLDEIFQHELVKAHSGECEGTTLRRIGMLDDGRMAGVFVLSQIFRGPFLSCYAGWRVNLEVCGQGLGTEGVTALLDAAFTPLPVGLGLHRVQANVIPTNAPSLRLAEKCGFRREGLATKYLEIAGEWQDHVMFAKLADEHAIVNQVKN